MCGGIRAGLHHAVIFLCPPLCISFAFTLAPLMVARWLPATVRAVCFLTGSRGRHSILQHQAELNSFALIRPVLNQTSGHVAENFSHSFRPPLPSRSEPSLLAVSRREREKCCILCMPEGGGSCDAQGTRMKRRFCCLPQIHASPSFPSLQRQHIQEDLPEAEICLQHPLLKPFGACPQTHRALRIKFML